MGRGDGALPHRASAPGPEDALRALGAMAAADTAPQMALATVRRVLAAEAAVWVPGEGVPPVGAPAAAATRAAEPAARALLDRAGREGHAGGAGGWPSAAAVRAGGAGGAVLVGWVAPRQMRGWERAFLEAAGALLAAAGERERAERRLRRLAALEEGQRLAREMHDGVAQSLGYLKLKAEVALAQAESPAGGPQLRATLEAIRRAAVDALGDLREAIGGLRAPAAGAGVGLADHLRRYVAAWERAAGVRADVRLEEDLPALAPDAEFQVLRIVAEALANTARHAGARHAVVEARAEGSGLTVAVRDDGRGFDPQAAAAAGHFGLRILRERGALLGGEVEVRSEPGGGTAVLLRVPAARGAPAVAHGR